MNEHTSDAIVTIGAFLILAFIAWLSLGDNKCGDCDSCQKIELRESE